MKTIRFFLCVIMLGLFLAGCQSESATITDDPNDAMKGYELYSWQERDQWYFSLLIGTNREKTLEEIQAPDTALKGIEALQPALEKIPAGQFVTWRSLETQAFPPEEIVKQVERICKDQGLEFAIVRQ